MVQHEEAIQLLPDRSVGPVEPKRPGRDDKQGRDVQAKISEQFLRHLGAGLVVTGFERGEKQSSYLLSAGRGDK